ncbi:Uncharacterised protein [Vibrio cholerae]|nr:Uncharacterised protein [Vibrio cholerae]CSI65967.1 Uncharacterised protein [Vibrio cholerae]
MLLDLLSDHFICITATTNKHFDAVVVGRVVRGGNTG